MADYNDQGIALLYQELAQRGINPAAASGAISGIMGESGASLNPQAFNSKDPGGGSGGIGQWNRSRLVGPGGMLAFAQNAGVPNLDVNTPTDAKKVPLPVQAQYLGHELDTSYAGVAAQLRNATSPSQGLNIWVNSYENPADKQAAIAQRSQYLNPVFAKISNPAVQVANAPGALPASYAAIRPPPGQAPGPIDPSIIAQGGVSPPIPAAATPGTTLNTAGGLLAGGGGGAGGAALPGFGSAQASNQFIGGLNQMTGGGVGKTMGMMTGQQSGQAPAQDIRPSPIMSGPGLRNAASPQSIGMQASQRTPNIAEQLYGQTLNSQPLAWGNQAVPAPAWLSQVGQQGGGAQGYGTSLNSQLAMLMNPYMLNQGSSYV